MMGVREAALAQSRAPRKISGSRLSAEDVICRVLCLGRAVNQKFAIVAKLVE
jgi:hypothetical protein